MCIMKTTSLSDIQSTSIAFLLLSLILREGYPLLLPAMASSHRVTELYYPRVSQVSGEPRPSVTWFRDDRQLHATSPGVRLQQTR